MYWSSKRKYKYFYWENFQVIHLSSGSFKVPVLMFLIVLHYVLNWHLSKWEVLNINFENQLLCGRTTRSCRTIGTAALPSPPISTQHGPPPSYFPKQVITNRPRCTPSPRRFFLTCRAGSREKRTTTTETQTNKTRGVIGHIIP